MGTQTTPKNNLLLNDIREWLLNEYDLVPYVTTDDRISYAVLTAYNSYVVEDNTFKTTKDFVTAVLKSIAYKIEYSALERSLYRNLKKIFNGDYTDILTNSILLANKFNEYLVKK